MKKETKERLKTLEDKPTLILRCVLTAIVIVLFVLCLVIKNTKHAAYCVLTLVIFIIPPLLSFIGKFHIPRFLEISILLYTFTAEIFGELFNLYIDFPPFDSILHFLSGLIFLFFGVGLINVFMKEKNYIFTLKPMLVVLFGICLTLSIGVLWEFFEYSGDHLFGLDMQRDKVVNSFNTVNLDETKTNTPVRVEDIRDVKLVHSNGEEESLGLGGYLDLGVYDTMKDLFFALISSLFNSIFLYIYLKSKGKRMKFVSLFIPYPDYSSEESK